MCVYKRTKHSHPSAGNTNQRPQAVSVVDDETAGHLSSVSLQIPISSNKNYCILNGEMKKTFRETLCSVPCPPASMFGPWNIRAISSTAATAITHTPAADTEQTPATMCRNTTASRVAEGTCPERIRTKEEN